MGESHVATVELFPALFEGDARGTLRSALKEMLQRTGIRTMTVHAPFGGQWDISSLDETTHQQALGVAAAAVDLAAEFGAPMVVVHASAEPIAPEERGRRLAQARRALVEIGRLSAAAGRRVAVELLPRSCLGNTVEELMELVGDLPGESFGVCLDTNHLMGRYRSLADDIRLLGNRLITTHLSDYDGVDEKHQLPGEGVLDWRAVMAALREIGYEGPLNSECQLHGDTPEQRIRSLEASFQWLRGL